MSERLPPGLEDFGARLQRAAAREIEERRREQAAERGRGRGGGLLRSIGVPVAAVLAAAVSAGAVGVVTQDGDPIAPDPSTTSPTAMDPAVVVGSAVDNPGGGPPWVVRAYTDRAGFECVQLGRIHDGVFGDLQRGQFRALPSTEAGTCATAATKGPLLAVASRAMLDLTIVYGLAIDRDPVTVRVGEREQRVRPSGLGAFVAVFEGQRAGRRIVVRSTVEGRPDVQPLG